ncbi:MAG: hypothetical protein FD155_1798 [Bacteroidetes bacterium]|nr:MAG: hypothetical protein FD155_1798 [Bacteroidota bacterium]
MVAVAPQAAVIIIVPERAGPVFAMAETIILPSFKPDGGVTVIHESDSDVVQLAYEEIFTV